jgi:CHASE2 domain-containing sensor protein
MERHNNTKTFWGNIVGFFKGLVLGIFYLLRLIYLPLFGFFKYIFNPFFKFFKEPVLGIFYFFRRVYLLLSGFFKCIFNPLCLNNFLENRWSFWRQVREWRSWQWVGFSGLDGQLFLVYFFIGLLGFLALTGSAHHWLNELRPVRIYGIEDYAMDTMIRFYQPFSSFPENKGTPLVLFDIDEFSYQKWKEPVSTPRDKLLKLIQLAVADQAEIIIVDINLSRQDKLNPEHDKQLDEYLKTYSETCTPNEVTKRCPQILLARFLRNAVDRKSDYKEQRGSFLDEAVIASKDIHWVSIEFDEESRYIIRRWRLWESTCVEEKQGGYPEILPSVELLTVALLKGVPNEPPEKATEPMRVKGYLLDTLRQFSEKHCIEPPSLDESQFETLKLGDDLILNLYPSPLQKRIFYRLSDDSDPKMLRQLQEKFSAENLIQAVEQERAGIIGRVNRVKGKVVIIGSSYQSSFDVHVTPVGEMPGAMIILNAINSLLLYGELEELPFWLQLIVMMVLLAFMSFIFIWLRSPIKRFVSFVPIIMLMLLLNFFLLNKGVWFNFTLAILIFQLYDVIVTYTVCENRFQESKEPESKQSDFSSIKRS